MQCVGALSWSMMGLAAPGFAALKEPAQPARRSRNLLGGDAGQAGADGRSGTPRMSAGRAGAPGALGMHADRTTGTVDPAGAMQAETALMVRRCLNGDSSAWAEMVRTHHKRVYGLCYRFTGNATDAEDLTQDVFVKIYSNLSSFDAARGSLPVWITTMTRNLLVDNFRRTRNQRATGSLDEGWDTSDDSRPARQIDRLMAGGISPHDAAVKKELEKMVQEALAQVSVELREAVILRDLQDLDYKEIAQVLDIPEGTVKSRISRGRAELARLLERSRREVM